MGQKILFKSCQEYIPHSTNINNILLLDGSYCSGEDVFGCYYITKDYYDRYRKPVMHSETNVFNSDEAIDIVIIRFRKCF